MYFHMLLFVSFGLVTQTELTSVYFIFLGDVEGVSVENKAVANNTKMLRCVERCLALGSCVGFSSKEGEGAKLDCVLSLDKKDLTNEYWSLYSMGRIPRLEPCGNHNGSIPFLRRLDGSEDFFRGWADYKAGFGDDKAEFWLGLDTLHSLTSSASYGLKVSMVAWNGDVFCSRYSNFAVGPEADGYRLSVSGYDTSSTGGDGMTHTILNHNGMKFSTKDADNDAVGVASCANSYKGGWWYRSCHWSNPTGIYMLGGNGGLTIPLSARGVDWRQAYGSHYSFKYMELFLTPN